MQLPDSVQNILAYGQGYEDGMKDGHICGFHDALVCAVRDMTGILKKYHEMEQHYMNMQEKARRERMKNMPITESEPVKHGHLIEGRTFNDQRCSECGQVFRDDINFILPFDEDGICKTPKRCPECGAYWDGGADNG